MRASESLRRATCAIRCSANAARHASTDRKKGADAKSIEILEQGLKNLADVVSQEFGVDFRDTPGAGAAGGLGFGLMSFCGATIRPGFKVVAEVLNLESTIAASDLVITGEGRLDAQTIEGKAAAGVAALARRHHKPVIAIAGSIEASARLAALFDATYSLVGGSVTLADAMREPAVHLQACASRMARLLPQIRGGLIIIVAAHADGRL